MVWWWYHLLVLMISFVYWTLNITWTVSYEIALVFLFVCPSVFAILAILHLGLLRISAQHRYIVQTSNPLFSSFFVAIYSLNETYFFISVFSDPVLFSFSFPVFYLPCLQLSFFLLCLSLHILYFLSPSVSFFVCLLLSFLLPSIFLLDFLYHLIFLSASISFFVFYFPSWLSSTLILCLSSFMFPLIFSSFLPLLFISFLFFFYSYYYHFILLFFFSVFSNFQFLSAFSAYFSAFFFLFYFSYFVLFSILFNYLVLILDFNWCKFSLIFIFSINLCYLFPFYLTAHCFLY